jgi:hypothetical protein
MTEQEWQKFTSLDFGFIWETECLDPLLTDRKCRLFAAACCRRIWQYIPDDASKQLIKDMECVADGTLTEGEWKTACLDYERPDSSTEAEVSALSAIATCRFDKKNRLADTAARYCSETIGAAAPVGERQDRRDAEERVQCDLIRDIFGNPFRPVAVDPSWLTTDVRLLAAGIYAERAFDRLPILADALQDAGCEIEDVLNHCRQPGEHVRGCWVVDLLTGRK